MSREPETTSAWTYVGRGVATAGVLVLGDPSYLLPAHVIATSTLVLDSGADGLPCPRDLCETWPMVRSKLTGLPIHTIRVTPAAFLGATVIEGLDEGAPYDVLARGTVSEVDEEDEEFGGEFMIDEVRLLFPSGGGVLAPASDDAPGWRLVLAAGPIDTGMFAILDPARALDDPDRGSWGIHYDHDVRQDDCREPHGLAAFAPELSMPELPITADQSVRMFRDGAMWIETELGGDAPYDLAARFEGSRLVEVSFRIDGVRLGSLSH